VPTAGCRSARTCATIHAFLEAVQEAEAFADNKSGGPGRGGTINAPLHKMWYRKRALEVVASRDLDEAALALTETMRAVLRNDPLPDGQDMWQYLDGPRAEFLRLAHDALYEKD
jgi:hypothetical protein